MYPDARLPHARPTRTRREFVRDACCGFGGLALASILQEEAARAGSADPLAPRLPHLPAIALGRPPTPEERSIALDFLRDQSTDEWFYDEGVVALAMFNLNGFLYVP